MQILSVMTKRLSTILLILLFSFTIPFYSACSGSRKSGCRADRTYKQGKTKKNRSNYGMRYGYKQSSPRKDYVIKNRKK